MNGRVPSSSFLFLAASSVCPCRHSPPPRLFRTGRLSVVVVFVALCQSFASRMFVVKFCVRCGTQTVKGHDLSISKACLNLLLSTNTISESQKLFDPRGLRSIQTNVSESIPKEQLACGSQMFMAALLFDLFPIIFINKIISRVLQIPACQYRRCQHRENSTPKNNPPIQQRTICYPKLSPDTHPFQTQNTFLVSPA